MQYMMLFPEPEEKFAERTDTANADAYWAAWMGFIGEMREAGIVVNGAALQGAHAATTIRVRDGQRAVQDGPFADAKEQLGGFVIIEVPGLDEAIRWAEKAPCARYAAVELRPVLPPSGGG